MGIFTIVISSLTCIGIITTSLVKPSFKLKNVNINCYWLIALLGASLLLIFGSISFETLWNGLTSASSINPIKILILFISMSLISIFLDELGFFSYIALYVLKRCKQSQFRIFVIFYMLVSLLTMFTSNDIIILTLTPFIITFCKRSNISPIPFLVSEFVAANTWSMIFIIGNPTNIYLALNFNATFVDYFLYMALPTLAAGIVEFCILILLFKRMLKKPIECDCENQITLKNKALTIIGLIILILATVLLVISNYINMPMFAIAAGSLIVLVIVCIIYCITTKSSLKPLIKTLKRGPYELIPFIISMFVIVLALNAQGITEQIAKFYNSINCPTFVYGYSSMLSANLINNIPMSVLYTDLVKTLSAEGCTKAMYASVIGSNIGAFITPIGALAGIMFLSILKKNEIKFSFVDFLKYGCLIGIPTITAALLIVYLY